MDFFLYLFQLTNELEVKKIREEDEKYGFFIDV